MFSLYPKNKNLKKTSWAKEVNYKFFHQKRKETFLPLLQFSFIGLVLGGMTLLTVLSIMNGLQKRFQDSLREIASFHARFYPLSFNKNHPPFIPSSFKVTYLFPFSETQALIQSRWAGPEPILIKGMNMSEWIEKDINILNFLHLKEGSWHIEKGEVLLGERLAFVLGAKVGEEIEIISLSKNSLLPQTLSFKVGGIWESDYYNLNRFSLFMNLEDTIKFFLEEEDLLWGIKGENPSLLKKNQLPSYTKEGFFRTWEEENFSFLQALHFEKQNMIILLALIFIIVALNTYYALRENTLKKQRELGILSALGANQRSLLLIFLKEGISLAFKGGILSILLGILLTLNLNRLLDSLEFTINGLFSLSSYILKMKPLNVSLRLSMQGGENLPLAIYWRDIFLIFSFIFFSTLISSLLAIIPFLRKKPSDLLRYV